MFVDPLGQQAVAASVARLGIGVAGGLGGGALAAGLGATAAIYCATSATCRHLLKCAWQLTKDLAQCAGKGVCPGSDPKDTEACVHRAWDNFQACRANLPPKYPRNPDGTLPFPKR